MNRIIIKHPNGKWQFIDREILTDRTFSELIRCGISQLNSIPILFCDLDHPGSDAIELEEDKELIVCGECGCLETKKHDCEVRQYAE